MNEYRKKFIGPALFYGAGTCPLKKTKKMKTEVTEMKLVSWMLDKTRKCYWKNQNNWKKQQEDTEK